MEGSESGSLATLSHLFEMGRSAARSSSVSSVSSCAILHSSDFFEQEATEGDKWRDQRASLWPHFLIGS